MYKCRLSDNTRGLKKISVEFIYTYNLSLASDQKSQVSSRNALMLCIFDLVT